MHKIIVHSKEEAREALTHQELDCIILVSISAVENYFKNEITNGQTPAIVLLAPQMESENAEQISPSAHVLKTPLRQLSLAYELRTILDSYLTICSKVDTNKWWQGRRRMSRKRDGDDAYMISSLQLMGHSRRLRWHGFPSGQAPWQQPMGSVSNLRTVWLSLQENNFAKT